MYRRFFKRIVDIVLATAILLMISPVLAAIAAFVFVTMGSPILFRQVRPGRHGIPFTILKFRTMRVPTLDCQHPQARLTAAGRFLRSTSLDELPELINVLRGDMSFVGPRPLLMQYLTLYSSEQARRHEVRPGITGLAQVKGRNTVDWERRFALDVEYVERCSSTFDLLLVLKTLAVVLRRHGVSEPIAEAPFSGSPSHSA